LAKPQTLTVPVHIGFIIDGNRRWAASEGLPLAEGHRRGHSVLRSVTEHAFSLGVQYVSAYIFSTENWSRNKQEVDYLMKLLRWVLKDELQTFHEKNIRLLWVGSSVELPASIQKAIKNAEMLTEKNTAGTFVLCLNHGGHREITEAVRRIVSTDMPPEDIDEATITHALDHPEVPPIDLIIRTSGEQRLSNFMLWRAAYSELIFRDEYWPAFSSDALDECLVEYSKRQRRFGG